MAQEKLTQLPAGSAVQATDIFLTSQSVSTTPVSAKVTAAQIATFVNGAGGGPYVPLAGGVTMTGSLAVPIPTSGSSQDTPSGQVVPFQTVQETASYFGTKQFCFLATTENLEATYDNGMDGVGATLTFAETGRLNFDGNEPTSIFPFNRVLVKDQIDFIQNGIYVVTNDGASSPAILTRADDFDGSSNGQISPGTLVYISDGDTQGMQVASLLSPVPIEVGTDDIAFGITTGGQPLIENNIITLSSGSGQIDYTEAVSTNNLLLNYHTINGTPGFLSWSVIPEEGFTIISTSNTDNSIVSYAVLNKTVQNLYFGNVDLVNGAATVDTALIASDSVVLLTTQTASNSFGRLRLNGILPQNYFLISSDTPGDSSNIGWYITIDDSGLPKGKSTLVGGQVTVSYPSLLSTDVVIGTIQNSAGLTFGYFEISQTTGTGFTIQSSSNSDTSTVGWTIFSADDYPTGTANLFNGTVTVNDNNIQSDSIVLLSLQIPNSTFGCFALENIIDGTSFNIVSNTITDNSTVKYVIIN